jgi:hypothetical protein
MSTDLFADTDADAKPMFELRDGEHVAESEAQSATESGNRDRRSRRMEINQQEDEWIATMSYSERRDIDGSPGDHAVAVVAKEYGVNLAEIRSRVVRYHDDGVTIVVSRGTDGQL